MTKNMASHDSSDHDSSAAAFVVHEFTSSHRLGCPQADVLIAVEGSALDLAMLAPHGHAVVAIGRTMSAYQPEGARGGGLRFPHGAMLHAASGWLGGALVETPASPRAIALNDDDDHKGDDEDGSRGDEGKFAFYCPRPRDVVAATHAALRAHAPRARRSAVARAAVAFDSISGFDDVASEGTSADTVAGRTLRADGVAHARQLTAFCAARQINESTCASVHYDDYPPVDYDAYATRLKVKAGVDDMQDGARDSMLLRVTFDDGSTPDLEYESASASELHAVALHHAETYNLHSCASDRGDGASTAACERMVRDLLLPRMLSEQLRLAAITEDSLVAQRSSSSSRTPPIRQGEIVEDSDDDDVHIRIADICPNRSFEPNLASRVPPRLTRPAKAISSATQDLIISFLAAHSPALEIGGPTTWLNKEFYESLRHCDNVVLHSADNLNSSGDSDDCERADCREHVNGDDEHTNTHGLGPRQLQYSVFLDGAYRHINFTVRENDDDHVIAARAFAAQHALSPAAEYAVATELAALVARARAAANALGPSSSSPSSQVEAKAGGRQRSAVAPSQPFSVGERVLGLTFFRDGSHTGLPSSSYHAVISSHNLEHYLDPFAALLEWRRLLPVGGMLLLVLPWAPGTFDRTRKPSNIFEILTGHILPSRQRLVHGVLDALVAGWSAPAASSSDPASTVDDGSRGSREAAPWWAQQALAQQRKPEGWERDMHWHVFDFATIAELLRCLGFGVEAMELVEPYHMVVVGRKIELPPPH